ncbi:unnamed protein product [Amaranthus hypochondriacus]
MENKGLSEMQSNLLKGSFGEMDTPQGLFMRLDFPGISVDSLKIVFNNKTKELEIRGEVPANSIEGWSEFKRYYATNICFNQHINDADYQHIFINGSLKLLFSLTNLKAHVTMLKGVIPTEDASSQSTHTPELGFANFGCRIEHPLGCPCCRIVRKCDSGEISISPELFHINSFSIGLKRHCLVKKLTENDKGWKLNLLVEVPGLESGSESYKIDCSSGICMFNGGIPTEPDHKIELVGRTYYFAVKIKCECCMFKASTVKHLIRDGLFVLSIQIAKRKTR